MPRNLLWGTGLGAVSEVEELVLGVLIILTGLFVLTELLLLLELFVVPALFAVAENAGATTVSEVELPV